MAFRLAGYNDHNIERRSFFQEPVKKVEEIKPEDLQIPFIKPANKTQHQESVFGRKTQKATSDSFLLDQIVKGRSFQLPMDS